MTSFVSCFVHGSDTGQPVTEADFGNDIDAYHMLIAHAIEVNLASFYAIRRRKSRPNQQVTEEKKRDRLVSDATNCWD